MFQNPIVGMFILFATIFLAIATVGTWTNLWYAKRDARKYDPDQIKFAQMMWISTIVALIAQMIAIIVTILLPIIAKF